MAAIIIRIQNRIAENMTDDLTPVCGNSGDSLVLQTDSEWNPTADKTVTLKCLHPDGKSHTVSVTAAGYPVLPVIRNTYMAEVSVSQGSLKTVKPAVIRFRHCITDGSGSRDSPAPDIYNMMMQYLATRDTGIMDRLTELRASASDSFPGEAYRLAADYGGRPTRISGTVTFADGTVSEITDADLFADSLQISARAVPDDFMLPGGVPSAELKCVFCTEAEPEQYHQAEIALTYHLQPFYDTADDDWFEIPLGAFTVSAAEQDTERGTAVTAYDDMQKFDRVTVAQLEFASGTAYTPGEIIAICAEKAGVTWEGDVSAFPNASRTFIMSDTDTSMETARDVLMNTVQILCAFAYVDRFRKLRVVLLQKKPPSGQIMRSQRKSAKLSRLTYRLYELYIDYTLIENGQKVNRRYSDYTLWANGVTAVLQSNPLWTVIDEESQWSAVHECFTAILDTLDPVTYLPAELETFGDPSYDLMDWLTVRSADGDSDIPVTSYTWKYNAGETMEACGTEAVAGIARTQAEKAAGSARGQTPEPGDNVMRLNFLLQAAQNGHQAFRGHTHAFLAHFTHKELGGETV